MNGEQNDRGVWIESDMRRREPSRRQRPEGSGASLWRLFFMQSSRSERTMDALGFFSVVEPRVRVWGKTEEGARELARRHSGYFNAGYYAEPLVAGVVWNLESRRAAGETIPPERIDAVKSALSSALAARANRFYDAVLIPLALTIASLFAISGSYLGPVLFLALYNYFHLPSRIGGFRSGAERGEGVDGAYVAGLFREERVLAGVGAFASGVFAALLLVKAREAGGASFAAAGAIAAAGTALLRLRWSPAATAYVVAAALALFCVVSAYFVL